MPDEHDFHLGRRPDRTYVSKPFVERGSPLKRIIYKVFDGPQDSVSKDAGDVLIHQSDDHRVEVRAYVYQDTNKLDRITFVKFVGSLPTRLSFTFQADDLRRFSALLHALRSVPLEPAAGERFDDTELADLMSTAGVRALIADRREILRQVVENDLTEEDIVGLAYRKSQLQVFEKLLGASEFFESKRSEWGASGSARVGGNRKRAFDRRQPRVPDR